MGYNDTHPTPERTLIMKNLKKRFMEDPQFALTLLIVGGTVAAGLMTGSAKLIEASAYAHRASKLK